MNVRDPDETAADTLARLADLTEGLPFEETDDDAALVERAIRLTHTVKGAVEAERAWCKGILDADQRDASDGRILATLANMAATRLSELGGQYASGKGAA